MKKHFNFSFLSKDTLGGLTAGIVALPLALAFGEQSGLGAAAGLYGAAFIAFFASLFGGTSTQVSGPTAPMTALSMVVIAGVLQSCEGRVDQAVPIILMVFLLAGVFQFLLGYLKFGTYIKYIPHPVVSGFMTGIGVIILLTQILPALGYYAEKDEQVIDGFMPHAEELILDRILKEEAEDGFRVMEDFEETINRSHDVNKEDMLTEATLLAKNESKGVVGSLSYVPKALSNVSYIELIICLITIAIIYGFRRVTTRVPSTLVALVLVSGVAILMDWNYQPISKIPQEIPKFRSDIFTGFDFVRILPYIASAFMLALLGAIDSLLTSVVADNMTRTRHDPNQELKGQGLGNVASALFGGLPGAGATIRTVVNIQAGGKTRISGMIAGIFLFVIMILLAPLASKIPAAVLAGILITVGFGVIDYRGLRSLNKMDVSERFILLTVLILTVFWQLVYAVGVGLIMASFVFLKRMSDIATEDSKVVGLNATILNDDRWEDEAEISESMREKVVFKHLSGPVFFGMVTDFRNIVSYLPEIHLLVIRCENVPFVDQSGVKGLEMALEELKEKDVVVALSGASQEIKAKLIAMNIIPHCVSLDRVFDNFEDCKAWLIPLFSTLDGLDKELEKLKAAS